MTGVAVGMIPGIGIGAPPHELKIATMKMAHRRERKERCFIRKSSMKLCFQIHYTLLNTRWMRNGKGLWCWVENQKGHGHRVLFDSNLFCANLAECGFQFLLEGREWLGAIDPLRLGLTIYRVA